MKTIIAIVLSFLFASVCVSQGVSLKDTLLWMHNFVADNSSQFTSQNLLDNQSCDLGPDCQQRHDVSTFDSRGCAVTVTWTITIGFKDNGTYTYRVSLKDLDPDTVKWTKDRPFENAVHVDTTNSVKAIAEAFSPPAGKAEEGDKQTWVELVFDNKADAERFVKAFKHAIRLCGGKPSAF